MLKLLFNTFLAAVLVVSTSGSKAYAAGPMPSQEREQFRLDFESQSDVKSIEVETLTVDSAKDAAKKVEEILETSTEKTIVSSAHPEVLEAGAKHPGRVALLPIAEAVKFAKDQVKGANELLRAARQNVINAAKTDKLGLAIVTYQVGNNVVRWVNADDLSTFAKTTGVIFLVLTAALVAVDKKSWPKVTAPFEEKWRKLLKYSANDTEHSNSQRLLLAYLGSASATTAINLGFIPILSLDRIAQGNAMSMVTPLVMGLITTASAFSWYEFYRTIAERKNARSTAVSKFLLNSRTLAVATVASTVMLLNSHAYGASPWIWLTVSGAAGIPLMLNANKIANWIENSPTINKVAHLYNKARTFGRRKQIATATPAQMIMCKDIFTKIAPVPVSY